MDETQNAPVDVTEAETINSNEISIIEKVKAIMRENLEFANTKEELEKFIVHSQLVIADFLKETPTEPLAETTESDTLE